MKEKLAKLAAKKNQNAWQGMQENKKRWRKKQRVGRRRCVDVERSRNKMQSPYFIGESGTKWHMQCWTWQMKTEKNLGNALFLVVMHVKECTKPAGSLLAPIPGLYMLFWNIGVNTVVLFMWALCAAFLSYSLFFFSWFCYCLWLPTLASWTHTLTNKRGGHIFVFCVWSFQCNQEITTTSVNKKQKQ